MKKITINNLKDKEKLLYYIKEKYPNLSSAVLHKTFRNKDIKVNSKRITDPNYEIKNGDIVEIYIQDFLLFGFPKNIDIVFEDDNILVVNKPQGILSNNEGKPIDEPTFDEFVRNKLGNNLKICHRLDRNTSGLLIFAKTERSYESLLQGFKESYIKKEYIAYVNDANFKYNHFVLENYLLKDDKEGYSKIYDTFINGSQKVVTEISVENAYKNKNYAILRVKIHTGKTHQIRSVLSYISHPIIGDSKYGKNEINKKFRKYKQLLFAVRYTFSFPKTDFLNYLNNIEIKLDENLYKNKI